MIRELDETIKRLLVDRGGLDPSQVDIEFEIPDREWASSISRPTVNCYLFDIHENRQLRDPGFRTDRSGPVARTRRPPWRIDLAYLITAWTKNVEDEHQVLWQVLATLAQHPILPAEVLQGGLAAVEGDIPTSVAQPDGGPLRSPGEFWSALDNKLKPSINYVVTLPLDTQAPISAPFVLSPITLRSSQWAGIGGNGGYGVNGSGSRNSAGGSGAGDGSATGDGSGDGAGTARGGEAGRGARAGDAGPGTRAGDAAGVGASGGAGGGLGGGASPDTGGPYDIVGSVRDAGGTIISTARVHFVGSNYPGANHAIRFGGGGGGGGGGRREGPGHGRGTGLNQSVVTNCEGVFNLYALPSGTHRVAIYLPGQPLRQRELVVPATTYDLILDDVPAAASAAPEPPTPPAAPSRRQPSKK